MTDELDPNEESYDDERPRSPTPPAATPQAPAPPPRPLDLASRPSDAATGQATAGRSSTWAVVLRAQGGGPRARAALGELLLRYEPTILGRVRAFGWLPWNVTHDDLKQEFLASVIARGDIHKLDPNRGESFRAWLNKAVKNFMLNEKESWLRQKRGNLLVTPVPCHALHGVTPELMFDRQFAVDTLLHALARHREVTKDKAKFDLWARVLPGPQQDFHDLGELAQVFAKTTNAVSVEILRLKQRHKKILREVVADTLDVDPDDPAGARAIDHELGLLYRALREVPALQVVLADA